MEPHPPADPLSAAYGAQDDWAPPGSADEGLHAGPSRAARREARAGLYVHVPFCARRCSYCDFSTGALSAHALERYLRAMALEIDRRAPPAAALEFTSVFFGGGTPSALPARAFRGLWNRVRAAFAVVPGAEITLEANPESVRPALLDAWREAGVNRLSLGVQSLHDDELRGLGRLHHAARPGAAVALARRHGFRRLSLDLMFGFPGHTEERWSATLRRALELDPEHISAYCLIPEPGTPLGDRVLEGALALPSPAAQADMYATLTATLGRAGYACYETSNFARPGAEARHNLVYWLVRPYLALGPAAHGFVNGDRYGNHYALSRWATALERGLSPEAERETQTPARRATEVMMLGLRLGRGLDSRDHPGRVWAELLERYGRALEGGVRARRLVRTRHGFAIPMRLRFVADDILAWIEARARDVQVDRCGGGSLTLSPCPSLHSPVG